MSSLFPLMSNILLGLLTCGLFSIVLFVACALVVQARKASATLEWRPPVARGQELQNWIASATNRIARRHLSEPSSTATAIRMVAEVEEGAMRAMLPLTDPEEIMRIVACPEGGQGLIGVSAPEAIAIADSIRRHLSLTEQDRILKLAMENANRLSPDASAEVDPLALHCALLGKDRVCCAYGSRPLRCRPLHAIAIANVTATQNGEPGEPIDGCRHVYSVAAGVEEGLVRAIKSAGLDAEVYELNSALVAVLSRPDAEERWSRGEAGFADCASLANGGGVKPPAFPPH